MRDANRESVADEMTDPTQSAEAERARCAAALPAIAAPVTALRNVRRLGMTNPNAKAREVKKEWWIEPDLV